MADWIWLDPGVYPNRQHGCCNTYAEQPPAGQVFTVVEFQRRYELPSAPAKVHLSVSADNAFDLSLNGKHLWNGPATIGGDWLSLPSFPQWYSDEYEWTPDGSKVIDFQSLVRLGPMRMNDQSKRQGGFWLKAEIVYADGSRQVLATDHSWQVRVLPAYVDGSHYNGKLAPEPWAAATVIPDIWQAAPSPIPVRSEQTVLPANGVQSYECAPGETLTVQVDFDKIYCGYPVLETNGPCEITCACYEDSPMHPHDKLELVMAGAETFRSLAAHSAGGFKLTVKNTSEHPVKVKPRLIETCYPVTQEGSFSCNDADLNLVYDVCKWTTRICRQNMHLDSPKHQEPLACTGDYYIESLITAFTYGDMRLAAFDIRRTARMLCVNDGRIFHTTYSLIWVKWLWDTYMLTGEKTLLEDCLPALKLLLARFRTYIGETGLVENPPDYMFVDWLVMDGFSMHHPPKYLGQTVLNAFYHGALQTAAEIYRAVGETATAERVENEAAALKTACCKHLYDKEKKLFVDGLGTPSPNINKWLPSNQDMHHFTRHANVLAVLCGLVEREEGRELLTRVLESDLPEVQPYFMHFVLDAVWQAGLFETYGMKILRMWIPMAKECPKGLKEGWFPPQPSYHFDYSHAWGGTPAYQLPARLLGFRMVEPGFGKVELNPQLHGLEFADIAMPTPYGMLRCRMRQGQKPELEIPQGLNVRVADDSQPMVFPRRHPFILLDDLSILEDNATTSRGKKIAAHVLERADKTLAEPVPTMAFESIRLIGTSADGFIPEHVISLIMAYQLTKKDCYAERLRQEMVAVANLPNWNPRHFLDTAICSFAMAVGYDWFYDHWTKTERKLFRNSLLEKGLKPSWNTSQWWIGGNNNWTLVCHNGMVAAALVVAEDEPELAERTVRRALDNLPRAFKTTFAPHGACPEGPDYWEFGTRNAVLCLELLEKSLNLGHELARTPGFAETAEFFAMTRMPNGDTWQFSDGTVRPFVLSYPLEALATRFQRDDWSEINAMGDWPEDFNWPSLTLAAMRTGRQKPYEASLFYYSGADAATPVAIMRTGNTPDSACLCVKGGTPSYAHAHMDSGAFCYVSQGVTWVHDLGAQRYSSLEGSGINIWDMKQDSQRWKVFRYGPFSHSVPMFGDHLPAVSGRGRFLDCRERTATMDLASLYAPDVRKFTRCFSLDDKGRATIVDTWEGTAEAPPYVFRFLTKARPEVRGNVLRLQQDGKILEVKASAAWQVTPAEDYMRDYDAPNPGAVVCSCTLENASTCQVVFAPATE